MSNWIKIEAVNASELLAHFELEDGAVETLHPDMNPEGAVKVLADNGFLYDAIRLLAHGLPKREAVWWACLVARCIQTPDTDQDNIDALIAAETWARKPTEDNRLRCKSLAEKTRYETPASWASTAAAWSTGSLAAEGEPEIEPPYYLYAHAVAGAVTLAGSIHDPQEPEKPLHYFLRQGANLAEGGNGMLKDEALEEAV